MHNLRRIGFGAGCFGAGAGAEFAEQTKARNGHNLPVHHARPFGSQIYERPHFCDEPGPDH